MPNAPRGHAARDSDLAEYFRQIREIPLLTPEEERELVARHQRDGCEQSRDRLVCGNLRLAVYIAKRYAHLGVPLQDLVEAGNVGLLLAVDRYDPAKGARFGSYAQWWIRRTIYSTLADQGRMIQVPESVRQARRLCAEIAQRQRLQFGRAAPSEEIAREAGVPSELARLPYTLSLSADPDGGLGSEAVADSRTESAEAREMRGEQRTRLAACVGALPEQQAAIVRLRFGIGGIEPLSTLEIGRKLGLREQHVRHRLQNALARLAVALRCEGKGDSRRAG